MTTTSAIPGEPLLTPAEVAAIFSVDPKTVTRWAKAGRITSFRTLGGHRRFRETEVRALIAGDDTVALESVSASLLEIGDRVWEGGVFLEISGLSPLAPDAARAIGTRTVIAGRFQATYGATEKVLVAPRPKPADA